MIQFCEDRCDDIEESDEDSILIAMSEPPAYSKIDEKNLLSLGSSGDGTPEYDVNKF